MRQLAPKEGMAWDTGSIACEGCFIELRKLVEKQLKKRMRESR